MTNEQQTIKQNMTNRQQKNKTTKYEKQTKQDIKQNKYNKQTGQHHIKYNKQTETANKTRQTATNQTKYGKKNI